MNDRRSCGRSETGSVICGNGNLTELYLGNNELLRTLDVRNCPNLTQAVDISGCVNIEHVYFDGTAITGLELPKGGIIKTLHLPETLTSLSVLDHAGITDFVLPSVDNLSTCRLENVGEGIDTKAMINALPARCRVRLIGFDWTVENEAELTSLKAVFDTMRGQNEAGGNEDIAQLYGRIHIVTITGAVLHWGGAETKLQPLLLHWHSFLQSLRISYAPAAEGKEQCHLGVPQACDAPGSLPDEAAKR